MDSVIGQDIHVIVRSVGERTERLCVERMKELFGGDCVSVIRNITPFSAAVKQSFITGIEKGCKWTFIIDADVFFWNDRIETFLDNSEVLYDKYLKSGNRIFCIQPYVFDNLFDSPRLAGVHLYRTELLSRAISFCDTGEGVTLRPETYVKRQMGEIGYFSCLIQQIVGIHDFFQYYSSIVKKGILHVNKHSDSACMLNTWERGQNENYDYTWALLGAQLGKKLNKEEIRVSNDYMEEQIKKESIVFPEQPVLTNSEIEDRLHMLENECLYERIYDNDKTVPRNKQLKDALLRYGVFLSIKKAKERLKGNK